MTYVSFNLNDQNFTLFGEALMTDGEFNEFMIDLSQACLLIYKKVPFDYYYDGESFVRFESEILFRESFKKQHLTTEETKILESIVFPDSPSEICKIRGNFPYNEIKRFSKQKI